MSPRSVLVIIALFLVILCFFPSSLILYFVIRPLGADFVQNKITSKKKKKKKGRVLFFLINFLPSLLKQNYILCVPIKGIIKSYVVAYEMFWFLAAGHKKKNRTIDHKHENISKCQFYAFVVEFYRPCRKSCLFYRSVYASHITQHLFWRWYIWSGKSWFQMHI